MLRWGVIEIEFVYSRLYVATMLSWRTLVCVAKLVVKTNTEEDMCYDEIRHNMLHSINYAFKSWHKWSLL